MKKPICLILCLLICLFSTFATSDSSAFAQNSKTMRVQLSPQSLTLNTSEARALTAKVYGTANRNIVWSVNGVTGGNAAVGTISSAGLYTAPTTNPNTSIRIRAASAANLSVFAECNVTINSPTLSPLSIGRFLEQSSFGPTPQTMTRVGQLGFAAYLDEQFVLPASPYPTATNPGMQEVVDRYVVNAVNGNDQLRQRTIYALSQIIVITRSKNTEGNKIVPWLNILSRNAFGNYKTLLKEITLDASMGHFLDMANSTRPTATTSPNENYAREIMQLFSIGLYELNMDGSLRLDGNGNPIPTYTQSDIRNLALAFTGWTYPSPNGTPTTGMNGGYLPGTMEPRPQYHDTSAKTFLGQTIPAGQTIQQDLDAAINIVFNHPNVAPFISTRLIRAFVKSNPSPEYIARISAIFENNGNGVRGDLKAVIRAILLDPEARNDVADASSGKLRTPLLHTAAIFRAFGYTLTEPLSFAYIYTSFGESILNAPSVFGHYSPMYRLPANNQLYAPEFQIYTPTEAVNRGNFLNQLFTGNGITPLDINSFVALAGNQTALVDAVDSRFLYGRMSPAMRQSIYTALQASTDNRTRAITALYLVLMSGDYLVQH